MSATRDQIVARSLALLPAACTQPGEHDRLTAGKVDDALDTLFGLGLLDLDRTAGAPRYRLDLRAFHQAPCPDLARLATHCGLHAIDDAARLRLLQTLVRHSFVPAGELRAVAAAIDRGQRAGRAGLATPEEMALLTAHITERSLARRTAGRATTPDPTAPPPLRRRSLDAELEEMAKRVAPGQTVQMGDPFDLAARAGCDAAAGQLCGRARLGRRDGRGHRPRLQLFEPRARILPEERLEAALLLGEAAVAELIGEERPGIAETRQIYLARQAPARDRILVQQLQELYKGGCTNGLTIWTRPATLTLVLTLRYPPTRFAVPYAPGLCLSPAQSFAAAPPPHWPY